MIEQLNKDLKEAMLAGDSGKVTAIKSLKASLQNAAIEKKGELSEEESIKVLKKEAKKRQEAEEMYRKGGRKEQANQEMVELEIIKSYLPEQLSNEALDQIIDETINELGAESIKEMGKVMSAVNKKVAGRADGASVASKVKSRLSGE